jgi:transforming growth factor-beta-induced protein
MKSKLMIVLSMFAVLAMSLVGGVSAQETFDNIVDVLAKDGRLETAYEAVIAAGLADTLASADNTFTVFVPRDGAFTNLNEENPGALDFLLGDPEGVLTDVLLYHVVTGKFTGANVAAETSLTTLNGADLTIDVDENGNLFINDARVVTADIPAKNGVIHVISGVLLPEDVEFPEAPAVVESDLPTIAEALAEDGRFTALLDALEATDLAETFATAGDYTLFAPTDEAFERLGDSDLTESDLRSILLYHVVGDSLSRDQLATDDLVPTMFRGRPVIVNRDGPMILNLSGARVENFNIPASNGVIHVIDRVMTP